MSGSLTSVELIVIPVVVVLAVILAGLGLLLIRRLRRKRDKLLHELRDSPELIQDRAFNRIAMARKEADIVGAGGADITSARALIAQAQGAFDTRNYDRAYESAQSAHEALVHARITGGVAPLASGRPSGPAPDAPSNGPSSPPSATPAAPLPTAPPIPKNRVESQFQLHLLQGELDQARAVHAPASKIQGAEALRGEAQSAFDHEDYTEAFRLALRGRKQLGGTIETLPPPTKGPASATADERAGPIDPGAAAERAASATRCPDCGYPMLPDDAFCRGCGRPKGELQCPHCGSPRSTKDTFCGRCGERFP